jgi:hypothetical protein
MRTEGLKFSNANAKIEALIQVPELRHFLADGRTVYSFDLLSGHSCPMARDCKSRAVVGDDGRRRIEDGPETEFRCFSASQEVQYTNVYNVRSGNFENLRGLTTEQIVERILAAMPDDLGICRIHVGGDLFSEAYLLAWVEIARRNPDRLYYAYTKSLPYWVANRALIEGTPNLVLTASRGGRRDDLIATHGLRSVKVCYTEAEAAGLPIDHDDSHAACPSLRDDDFALLLHGTQPKGSEAAEALKALKRDGVKHSYSRKTAAA